MILRLLLLATATLAHISLKYPPVRYPPLDFLDNVHTQQPCGVPRPPVPRYTDLNVGETYNISWRMQYPTKGGLRLTLMDESGKLIQKILPASETSNFTDANNDLIFATQFRPSKPCEQCIIRIEQQALENGSSYEFYSCADINILETEPNIDDLCSGNGIYKDGECVCKHLYSGDVCQFKGMVT
uniref:EGF-like domain-containing protein n=1 Tax=Syphacia muris TaxID=451379 RepID=A0A0N5B047_9BILA